MVQSCDGIECIPSVHTKSLKLQFGDRVLVNQLDLEVRPGEFLAISGPSGSGKTTLLQALTGFGQISGGEVWWEKDGTQCHPSKYVKDTGFVYQHLRLARQLSALSSVCCGRLGRYKFERTLLGFNRSDKENAYAELKGLGLQSVVHKKIGLLSGGERQRVALARALHQEPLVYFVDEPVANLDRTNAQLVLARLRREVVSRGRTVVAVLHDDTQINLFADRVLRWERSEESLWRIETIREHS